MLEWDAFPKVNVAFMDQDHHACLDLIQRLLSAIDNEQSSNAVIDEELAALGAHLTAHFSREERAMEETGFPPYYVHKAEHDSVLQEFQQNVREWQGTEDRTALRRFIAISFSNWLETHALMMDMVTAQHLKKSRV